MNKVKFLIFGLSFCMVLSSPGFAGTRGITHQSSHTPAYPPTSPNPPVFSDPTVSGPALGQLSLNNSLVPNSSNETSVAVDPSDPAKVLFVANPPDVNGFWNHVSPSWIGDIKFSRDGGTNLEERQIENPNWFGNLTGTDFDPFNADMIIRAGPGGTFYGIEDADKTGEYSSIKFFKGSMGSDGKTKVDSVLTMARGSFPDPGPNSGLAPQFDKPSLAVDLDPQSPTYGWTVGTFMEFGAIYPPSTIHFFFADQNGVIRRQGTFSYPNLNVSGASLVFGEGGALDLNFNQGGYTMYNIHFQDVYSDLSPPRIVASSGNPLNNYLPGLLHIARAESDPMVAANPKDGSEYLVYDDPQSGKSQTYLVELNPKVSGVYPHPILIPSDTDSDHWMSSVAVDPATGAIAVTYRAVASDHLTYERKGVMSFDGGKTWSLPIDFGSASKIASGDGSGDYEETAIGSRKNPDGTVTFFVYAPHQENGSVYSGAVELTLNGKDVAGAYQGNSTANWSAQEMLAHAIDPHKNWVAGPGGIVNCPGGPNCPGGQPPPVQPPACNPLLGPMPPLCYGNPGPGLPPPPPPPPSPNPVPRPIPQPSPKPSPPPQPPPNPGPVPAPPKPAPAPVPPPDDCPHHNRGCEDH